MSVSEQTTLAFNARRVATMGDTEAIFRIYIAAGGLFFIRVSGETNTTTAYLVGGVIGLMITRAMNSNKKKVAAKINDMDQKSLRDRLEDSPSNFRVAFEEIENATLNAPSFWNRQGKHAGRWVVKFEQKRGKKIFDVLEIEDMHVAMAELPKALKDRLTVNAEWNEDRQKYLKRRKP